jgi:glycosyltransferase involved in cell wall biosynthesis
MATYKGLVVGDAVSPTGFARVIHSVIDNLPKDKYEIHHLGINYFGDPHNYSHRIYPASLGGDVFGIERLPSVVTSIKPDFIFIVNDPWIIDIYLERLRKLKEEYKFKIIVYFPVDAEEHSPSFYKNFDLVDRVCVYTEFGKKVILSSNSDKVGEEKIRIIPHGISTKTFYPIDQDSVRYTLFPKDRINEFKNSFIVLNGNRNQPRKRIDLTMWIFKEFQKGKPDVKLYLHMGLIDMGFNIAELAVRYGFDKKLIISTTDNSIPGVSDEKLNMIYNACNVGINTSIGEGWGLVNWEHAATGKLQILPNHSALTEIWKDSAVLVPTVMPQMIERINTVGKVVSITEMIGALDWAYDDWKYNRSEEINKVAAAGYKLTLDQKYTWQSVAHEFNNVFSEVL